MRFDVVFMRIVVDH